MVRYNTRQYSGKYTCQKYCIISQHNCPCNSVGYHPKLPAILGHLTTHGPY